MTTTETFFEEPQPAFDNPSWPLGGPWDLTYNSQKDRYVITTNTGQFVAEVGPTLVAYWMVENFNFKYNQWKKDNP